jgi:hypothetical protein
VRKPTLFECKVFIEFFQVDDVWEAKRESLENICNQYGFNDDTNCGQLYCYATDTIYENLESRIKYFTRQLKEAKFKVEGCVIKAVIYNSNIHGELK